MRLRLAHLSDIHFGGENKAAVEGALEWLHREATDLIVLTGDITSVATEDEFNAAAAWARAMPSTPVATPGNHDVPYVGPSEILERVFAPWRRWDARFGPRQVAHRRKGVALTCVNTARSAQLRLNWSKGAISRGQAAQALADLAAGGPAELKVIACHHPLVEMIGGPMTARVRGGEAAARRFCEAGVDLILTGHIHAPFAMPLPYGDGHAYAVGAGTLSRRERGVPPSFNAIAADETEITVVAQAWTGSHFEPWRTWNLPRRRAA